MEQFNIGDIVVAVAPVGLARVTGVCGRVVGFDDPFYGGYIAVEFDDDIDGNETEDIECEDEDYECPSGHGWFVLPGDIAHVAELDDFTPQGKINLF